MRTSVSGKGQPPTPELKSRFTSTTGGVLTVEVGAITGDLELITRPTDSGIETEVRYAGAHDLYTVTGSPVPTTDTHHKAHEAILKQLTIPGRTEQGNELPVDLTIK
jgi:hypothetical protein